MTTSRKGTSQKVNQAAAVLDAFKLDTVEFDELLGILGPTGECPTFAASIPAFLDTLTPNTRASWNTGLRRFLQADLAETGIVDLSVSKIRALLRKDAEGRSRRSGSSISNSVLETSITATRAYVRWLAGEDGFSLDGMAAAIEGGLRHPRKRDVEARQPLTHDQLEDVFRVSIAASEDPLLTATALSLVRETAIRRGTTLVPHDGDWLRLGGIPPHRLLDLDYRPDRSAKIRVWMPKVERYIIQRITRGLAYALLSLRERATCELDEQYLLLQRSGRPITRKFWETLGEKVDEACPWARELDFGPHLYRHTTLSDVRAATDHRVSTRYGGQKPLRGDINGTYTKATASEAHEAHRFLFGD